jgi:hypothetical protein
MHRHQGRSTGRTVDYFMFGWLVIGWLARTGPPSPLFGLPSTWFGVFVVCTRVMGLVLSSVCGIPFISCFIHPFILLVLATSSTAQYATRHPPLVTSSHVVLTFIFRRVEHWYTMALRKGSPTERRGRAPPRVARPGGDGGGASARPQQLASHVRLARCCSPRHIHSVKCYP